MLELQKTVLLIYSTLTTKKSLANKCLSLDQGLCKLKAWLDRLKVKNIFISNLTNCNTLTRTSFANCNTFMLLVRLLTRELTLSPFTTTNLKTNFTSFNLTYYQFSNP